MRSGTLGSMIILAPPYFSLHSLVEVLPRPS